MRGNLFWLSDDQWQRIEPLLPTDVRGKERADDLKGIGPLGSARAYYAASGLEGPATILGTLVSRHSFAVEERQRNAWLAEISQLKTIAAEHPDAFFFLEFAIPRSAAKPGPGAATSRDG